MKPLTSSLIIKLMSAVLASAFLFIGITLTATTVKADGGTDGRLNAGSWGNSWGGAAVYYTPLSADNTNAAQAGITVLNQDGKLMLYVSGAQIAHVGVPTSGTALLGATNVYQLSRDGAGNFWLTSVPDVEGKTFVGEWDANGVAIAPMP